MKRERSSFFAWIVVYLFAVLSAAAAPRNVEIVEVRLAERRVAAGARTVIVSVYEQAEGGEPIATETRTVRVDERGSFTMPLGQLTNALAETKERWLAVRVPPGVEARRVPLAAATVERDVTVHVVTDAAITANGLIESIAQGFRFPDGTIQTSAATVSGGVPSVNGIGGPVTIVGAGSTTVSTAASTITVTGPAFGTPVAVGTSNAAGAATTIARADHVHAHGDQAGGSLHADATTGSAGFMSAADKVKLDATVAYVRTVVVSPVTGDPIASGTALLNALAGISGSSASKPFLLKIEPGVYDIGASVFAMKVFVDVEGSGENVTFIVAARGGSTLATTAAAVVAASNSELRHLTVTNTAPGTLIGIGYFTNTLGNRMTHVTINSTGATQNAIGAYGVSGATATLSRVTITATATGGTSSAAGIQLSNAKFVVLNSSITGKGVGGTGSNIGVNVTSSSGGGTIDSCTILATGTGGQNTALNVAPGKVDVLNSTLQAETNGSRAAVVTSGQASAIVHVFHSRLLALATGFNSSQVSASKGSTSTLRIAASQLDSAAVGTPKCVHVYDKEMDDQGNACPGPIA